MQNHCLVQECPVLKPYWFFLGCMSLVHYVVIYVMCSIVLEHIEVRDISLISHLPFLKTGQMFANLKVGTQLITLTEDILHALERNPIVL